MTLSPYDESSTRLEDDKKILREVVVTYDHLLNETVSVTQPKRGYRVGTDAVLLSAALSANRGRVLDMGAGVGGVSLCLARRLDRVEITAIEIDPVMAALAKLNAANNGFEERLRVLTANITKMPSVMADFFDHVVSNPPYHYAAGTRPEDRRRALAHMGDGDGLISFICRADRGAELINLFAAAGASETVVFPLWPRLMVPAGRVIVTVRKNISGPGAILPGLVLHNDDGSFTEAASAIMKGKALSMLHPARRSQRCRQ
jgi:tRNA1Val (adenine37-N6)-methyltransferase